MIEEVEVKEAQKNVREWSCWISDIEGKATRVGARMEQLGTLAT